MSRLNVRILNTSFHFKNIDLVQKYINLRRALRFSCVLKMRKFTHDTDKTSKTNLDNSSMSQICICALMHILLHVGIAHHRRILAAANSL